MNYKKDLSPAAQSRVESAAIKAIAEAITMESPVWNHISCEELPFGWFLRPEEDDQYILRHSAPGGWTEHGIFSSREAAVKSAWVIEVGASIRTISIPEFSWNEGGDQ